MKLIRFLIAAVMLSLLALPFKALAIVITPQYTNFGTLAAATFGGTGIPNNAVAITTYTQSGGGTLTLGLTAHQRGDNVGVTNNGLGTFTAAAGADASTAPVAVANYATWNVGFYVSGVAAGQTTEFYYDTDSNVGNNVATAIPFGGVNGQDSWNMGMGFLGGAAFPEMASGEYAFALVTRDAQGLEIARSAIIVNVGGGQSVPDGGATIAMLGLGLVAMGLVHQRRTRQSDGPALMAA